MELEPVAQLTLLARVGRSGEAKHVRLERLAAMHRDRCRHHAEGEEDAVDREPRAAEPRPALLAAKTAERVVADEAALLAEAIHHVVARVDAGSAGDAVELEPLPDVDAGRTDHDAAVAVDAGAASGVFRLASRLAASLVVTDDEGVVVDEHRLEAAVGAHHDAELLAEDAERDIEQRGRAEHPRERLRMCTRARADHLVELRERDEVREEDVGREGRGQDVERMGQARAPHGVEARRLLRALERRVSRAVHEALDRTEDRLDEHRLRACPAAPCAPEERRHAGEPEAEPGDGEEQEPDVLSVEGRPEEEEATALDVEEDRGVPADPDPRERRPERDEREVDDATRADPAAADVGRVGSSSSSVGPERAAPGRLARGRRRLVEDREVDVAHVTALRNRGSTGRHVNVPPHRLVNVTRRTRALLAGPCRPRRSCP